MNNISGRSVDTDTATGWGSGDLSPEKFLFNLVHFMDL